MGECHWVIELQNAVYCVNFSPKNPQTLMSASGTIQQWGIDGHKIGPTYSGNKFAFSPDGTQFVLNARGYIKVQDTNSGTVAAKFSVANSDSTLCCFSPDSRLVAVDAGNNICVWDITGLNPLPVETFVGHTNHITSLAFSSPSTLISVSQDKSIKFWQIGTSSADPVVVNPKSTLLALASTKSIALETKNSPIIPSDLDRVIKTWGISTGLSKRSLKIPTEGSHQNNIQLIDSNLILVWYEHKEINIRYAEGKINIWHVERGELLKAINVPGGSVQDLRVSGDGSKVFCLYEESIQAWGIWTGKAVGEVRIRHAKEILVIDGSKVWVNFGLLGVRGWDFGVPGSSPIELSNKHPDRLHLNDTKLWEIDMSRMKDIATGKVLLQLPERFGKVVVVQWGGQYLVASFRSNEVLILDLNHMFL